jgi:hypothetical protein
MQFGMTNMSVDPHLSTRSFATALPRPLRQQHAVLEVCRCKPKEPDLMPSIALHAQ